MFDEINKTGRFAWCHPVLQQNEEFQIEHFITWIKYHQAIGFEAIYVWYEENMEHEVNLLLRDFPNLIYIKKAPSNGDKKKYHDEVYAVQACNQIYQFSFLVLFVR